MKGTVYTTKEKKMKDYEDHHLVGLVRHDEEVLYLQPMIPLKRFDIFPPD